ncbi:hypothetical protein IAQ61_000384 [Plenodomus lingam]|uniref:Uncharacterized protein n=1 Tax=Leptosphaeria maculans (strain JN3 / isolate v23.1.3 / race Av1-4-5-6-7-8) TaxID=985895 RepID=E5R4T3_LEPMJ|nr:hypothetical protein LEMA_P049120.1 [Plenodomus lingam JN3]KAH9881657.1 hypothetical protein IAQ61_000384 [Plenodomus lingam]CBX92206.1 hypothetical protein LEMA_P049120.1 [Plenodomus lingam JN3]
MFRPSRNHSWLTGTIDDRLSPGQPARKRKSVASPEGDEDVAHASQSTPQRAKKTKRAPEIIDLTASSPEPSPRKRAKRNSDAPVEEKRLRQFRTRAPQSYLVVKERALTQRLTVLSRERCGTEDIPQERVRIAGSTGNVYTVRIDLTPRCDCPHALKGNQCKHVVYVMLRVLKARDETAYQLALLSSELRELIQNAPPIPGVETNGKDGTETEGEDTNRKPIEGECPICYDELEDKDHTVYCKSSCGNNVHKDCMQKWIAISMGTATCPYCRAKWPQETGLEGKLGEIDTTGLEVNEDGYVNVARQLGLDGERDYSTYHQRWVRRQWGYSGGRASNRYDYGDYYH